MRGRGHAIRSRLVPSRGGGGQSRWRGQGRSNHRVLTATPELLLLYEQWGEGGEGGEEGGGGKNDTLS